MTGVPYIRAVFLACLAACRKPAKAERASGVTLFFLFVTRLPLVTLLMAHSPLKRPFLQYCRKPPTSARAAGSLRRTVPIPDQICARRLWSVHDALLAELEQPRAPTQRAVTPIE
jgi:hypothetical protein